MAIFSGVPDIEVTIHQNGAAMDEYDDNESHEVEGELKEYQASKTVSKYIESRTGQEFSVEVRAKLF